MRGSSSTMLVFCVTLLMRVCVCVYLAASVSRAHKRHNNGVVASIQISVCITRYRCDQAKRCSAWRGRSPPPPCSASWRSCTLALCAGRTATMLALVSSPWSGRRRIAPGQKSWTRSKVLLSRTFARLQLSHLHSPHCISRSGAYALSAHMPCDGFT